MYSTSIKGTHPNKIKMSWYQYWIGHCWMTGWQTIRSAFDIWADLMTSNYENYALIHEDNPYTECAEWFWVSLNEDDVYPKEFLECLMQMVEDIELGKVETYPMDEVIDRVKRPFTRARVKGEQNFEILTKGEL